MFYIRKVRSVLLGTIVNLMHKKQQYHNIFTSAAPNRLSYIHGLGLHRNYIHLHTITLRSRTVKTRKDNLLVLHAVFNGFDSNPKLSFTHYQPPLTITSTCSRFLPFTHTTQAKPHFQHTHRPDPQLGLPSMEDVENTQMQK